MSPNDEFSLVNVSTDLHEILNFRHGRIVRTQGRAGKACKCRTCLSSCRITLCVYYLQQQHSPSHYIIGFNVRYLPPRPSLLRTLHPPGCKSSPIIRSGSFISLSTRMTWRPSLASTVAIDEPRIPDPTTITLFLSPSSKLCAGFLLSRIRYNKQKHVG